MRLLKKHAAVRHVALESIVLMLLKPAADTKLQPPTGKAVKQSIFFGTGDRILQRPEDDPRADAQLFSALRHRRAQYWDGREVAAIVVEVVLGKPDRVKTVGLGPVGFDQHVLIELLLTAVELRK